MLQPCVLSLCSVQPKLNRWKKEGGTGGGGGTAFAWVLGHLRWTVCQSMWEWLQREEGGTNQRRSLLKKKRRWGSQSVTNSLTFSPLTSYFKQMSCTYFFVVFTFCTLKITKEVGIKKTVTKREICILLIYWGLEHSGVLFILSESSNVSANIWSSEKVASSRDLWQKENRRRLRNYSYRESGVWQMIFHVHIWKKQGGVNDLEEGRERKRNREMWGGGKNERLQRERERERERTSLLGGFPEVTVLNITEECGMLNRCQGKHTDRATAAPNSRQGLLYIHTKTHKHADISVHKILIWALPLATLTHWLLGLPLCVHIEYIWPCRKESTPAGDIIFGNFSWLHRQSFSRSSCVHMCSSV